MFESSEPFSPNRSGDRTSRWIDLACAVAVFVLAVAPYLPVLREPLNGVDGIASVAAVRLGSWTEAPSLLVRELRGGAQAGAYYWRPITSLSYAIDYALWGWNAVGFHLTDLTLAGLAAVAVYGMTRVAFGRGAIFAAVVAALFALHPSANEVVPSVSRRQEPILVIGLCLAVMGSAWLPARRGFLLQGLGCLVAVTSVERGLVVPAVVGAYVLLCHPAGGSFALRLGRATLWTLPALGVAVAFFVARSVLFGSDGIHLSFERFSQGPLTLLLRVVYPQQMIDLEIPHTAGAIAAAGIAALGVAGCAALALLRSRELPVLAFCAAWAISFALLIGVAGQSHPWYAYTAVPPMALAAVVLVAEGVHTLRRHAGAITGFASIALGVMLVGPSLIGAPLWTDYPGWRVTNHLTSRLLEEVLRVSTETPAGESLIVLNLPGAWRRSESDWRVTQSAAGLWPRSVRVWAEVSELPQTIIPLGAASFVGKVTVPRVEQSDGVLSVWFDSGTSEYLNPDGDAEQVGTIRPPEGRGMRFRWPLKGASETVRVYVFDGESLIPLDL